MTGSAISHGSMVRFERGLCPRNPFRGMLERGAEPPFEAAMKAGEVARTVLMFDNAGR
jgi:hypothetical protein